MTSSHQLIPLQTASMDVSRKLVHYCLSLVKTKRRSSPSFLPLRGIREGAQGVEHGKSALTWSSL